MVFQMFSDLVTAGELLGTEGTAELFSGGVQLDVALDIRHRSGASPRDETVTDLEMGHS